jgi:hypothetical protein
MYGSICSANDDIVWKGLQPAELPHAEAAILPVKWAGPWSGLGLDSPRRPRLRELQEEAPKPSPPSEKGFAAAAFSVPKVVLSLWNGGQQIGPFAAQRQIFILIRLDISEGIPSGSVRLKLQEITNGRMGCGRKTELAPIAAGNHEEAIPHLRNTEVRRAKHRVRGNVICFGLRVDLVDHLEDKSQTLALSIVG